MKILLAIDSSKFSEAATQTVVAQARPQKDEVRILHVVGTFPHVMQMNQYYPGKEHARDAEREFAEKMVAKTAELLRSRGLQVSTGVEWGDAKSKIIDAATKWRADLIVLGSHGEGALTRFLMGDVADAVARHAQCSVEIVRIHSNEQRRPKTKRHSR